jgi:uncharacterized SAM-binding protein YcdF (DUF218 family)
MFFYLAKALWFIAQPSTLIALLVGYGAILIWTGWARWGRRFATAGALLLLVAGLSPLGNALILPLEDRFPRANLDAGPGPTGFIVLGGPSMTMRAVAAVALSRRFPDAKIVFTGGDAGIFYKSANEASYFASLLTAMGVPPDRLILEDKSRDTFENAAFLKAELGNHGLLGPGARWLLITSAYHMPRAMGVFRKAEFTVEPWPVDYRTRGGVDFTRPLDRVSEGLQRVDIATHEWVGLLAYWITGRSDTLFPGPKPVEACDLGTAPVGSQPAFPCRPSS